MEENRWHDESLPPELAELGETLRSQRHRGTPLELDRIKLQAKRQAAGRPPRHAGSIMRLRRHALTIAIAVGLVATGGGAAAAMSGKIFTHHHTASAAWFQYKPPCPPHKHHKGDGAKFGKAHASWKHEDCKPPPPPPCNPKGKQARAAGAQHGCPPPPCSKSSKARAAGANHSCPPPPCSKSSKLARAAGNNPCDNGGSDNAQQPPITQTQPPVTTNQQPTGAPNVQTVTHKAKKHKAKKHHRKARRHAKKHHAKKHHAKKHAQKNSKKH